MSSPLISVIIPTYKQVDLLPQTVRSVLDQTYDQVEIVVIDDGSPDDVPAALAPFGDRVRLLRQINAGPSAARNAGLRLARGDCCLFLDGDDWLEPHALQRHADVRRATGAAVTVSGWREVLPGGSTSLTRDTVTVPADLFHGLLRGNLAVIQSFVCDVQAVRGVGGFDEMLFGCEDWELWLKLAAAGHVFAAVPGALGVYRKSAGTLSTNYRRMYDTAKIVVERYSGLHGDCAECQSAAQTALDYFGDTYFRWQVSPQLRRGPARWQTFCDAASRAKARPRMLPLFAKAVGRALIGGRS